ncbi:MAG: GTP-binding protein, partial [Clostridia bacterium]|nr:GTP-binding protein [Clostridia bacterium]
MIPLICSWPESRNKDSGERTVQRKMILGLLAHVDAGKTTLSEALLYTSGALRKLGRVDHKDAFLDTDVQERERGITIFSKQARLAWKETAITLMDTPGHVDFSSEMERTLQVLDAAVLVISGIIYFLGNTLRRLKAHLVKINPAPGGRNRNLVLTLVKHNVCNRV